MDVHVVHVRSVSCTPTHWTGFQSARVDPSSGRWFPYLFSIYPLCLLRKRLLVMEIWLNDEVMTTTWNWVMQSNRLIEHQRLRERYPPSSTLGRITSEHGAFALGKVALSCATHTEGNSWGNSYIRWHCVHHPYSLKTPIVIVCSDHTWSMIQSTVLHQHGLVVVLVLRCSCCEIDITSTKTMSIYHHTDRLSSLKWKQWEHTLNANCLDIGWVVC